MFDWSRINVSWWLWWWHVPTCLQHCRRWRNLDHNITHCGNRSSDNSSDSSCSDFGLRYLSQRNNNGNSLRTCNNTHLFRCLWSPQNQCLVMCWRKRMLRWKLEHFWMFRLHVRWSPCHLLTMQGWVSSSESFGLWRIRWYFMWDWLHLW